MLQGIAQFWAGRVTANGDGSYSIDNVARPDEYSNGVRDGVHTHAVAATVPPSSRHSCHSQRFMKGPLRRSEDDRPGKEPSNRAHWWPGVVQTACRARALRTDKRARR